MVQTGDPDGDGYGGAGKEIIGEFASNGIYNPVAHKAGVLSMARTGLPNSASSQFFICLTDAGVTPLDGDYAAFGQVIEGMEYVTAIGKVATNANDRPLDPPVITEARLVLGENAPISGFGIFLFVIGGLSLVAAVVLLALGANAARKQKEAMKRAAAQNFRNKKKQRTARR